jgi:hypothetical protein
MNLMTVRQSRLAARESHSLKRAREVMSGRDLGSFVMAHVSETCVHLLLSGGNQSGRFLPEDGQTARRLHARDRLKPLYCFICYL